MLGTLKVYFYVRSVFLSPAQQLDVFHSYVVYFFHWVAFFVLGTLKEYFYVYSLPSRVY